ncbi:rab escort protein 1 [Trifolium pratense]|uniref:rab escort protein 1 n=1 Tax=Trifolium pratense TaxID=57577 RepID=UPI001E6952BA|nr:rab escort protein 1 [Trifolium pratense]
MTAAEELSSYPPIDPVNFDLIIVGTGLSESIIAAAASAVGKTILHLDPNSFYGSHFASLSLEDFTSYLNSSPKSITAEKPSTTDSDYTFVNLIQKPLFSDAEFISCDSVEDSTFLRENSRKFNLDLGGPRALFSADKTIDLLLKSGAAQYLEFKGIDASFVYNANEGLMNVPDSRGAIFRDKNLSLKEKNQLMKFFKLVQQHLGGNEDEKISEEDLESSFVSFLEKIGLPPKIKSILLYAIAMVDFDQENGEVCKDLLKTKDGIDRLAQYSSSVGRFPNAPGALLYPIYGEGELPQAFCRRAAVKGCIYVLRMPVIFLLTDKVTGSYKGVRLASGQDLYSHQLILDPSFTIPSTPSSSPNDSSSESFQILSQRDIKGMVARGICITRNSIKPDVSNCSVVYSPRSLYPDQVTSVRALQIGANLAVCPVGTFVLYFSTLCNDADEGKKLLKASMNALLTLPGVQSDSEDRKPIVLWSAFYIQKLTMSKFEAISSTPTPDGNLNYNDLLDATEKLFGQMYPNEEFFPKTTSPEDTTDDDENGIIMENGS